MIDDFRLSIFELPEQRLLPLPNQKSKINNLSRHSRQATADRHSAISSTSQSPILNPLKPP
jgi:hypothetical protein